MKTPEQKAVFVIFGATGDLAQKKLFPALFELFAKGAMPEVFQIIAVSRREWQSADFQAFIRDAMLLRKRYDPVLLSRFIARIHYSKVFFDSKVGYEELATELVHIDKEWNSTSKKIIYLSLAPTFYEDVVRWVGEAKIIKNSYDRLLIEKPFGFDARSATKLFDLVRSFFKEKQALFVDHYLGKDTVRALFEGVLLKKSVVNLFNKKYLESVYLKIHESIGIEKRGASYDSVGAFRDIAENHMMMMLVGLLSPFTTSFFGNKRAKIIKNLATLPNTHVWARAGQYDGYLKEAQIPETSTTDTAFTFSTFFKGGKFKNAKVIFEGGKKLPNAFASIEVFFKDNPLYLKRITASIQPEAHIVYEYGGGKREVSQIKKIGDAYEAIFKGALEDTKEMFVSRDEIVASWKVVDPITEHFKSEKPVPYSELKPFIV